MQQGVFIEKTVIFLEKHHYGLLLFGLPFIGFHLLLFRQFPQTNALVDDWAWHAQLFTAFVIGYIVAGDQKIESAISGIWRNSLLAAIILTISIFVLRGSSILPVDQWWRFAIFGTIYRLTSRLLADCHPGLWEAVSESVFQSTQLPFKSVIPVLYFASDRYCRLSFLCRSVGSIDRCKIY